VLPDDAPAGVCPQCLFGIGMQAGTQPADTLNQGSGFVPPKPHALAKHFPQLEILDLIGQGGMGAVYKARQRGLDRLVAIKILPPKFADEPAFAERFAREARMLARLNHPNIIGVYDTGQAGGYYYLLMEFVDGINLREAIQTGELTPKEALAIVPQVCDALQYAHEEGIVHRDIKPENLLLDKKGRVKIADFGLVRLLGPTTEDFTLTGTHQVMGTPRYMAPEQMEGSHDIDHRADIYSLGVVFYEMLTGELPLGRFEVPSKKVQLDVRLDEIVLRTLEKEPGRRYQAASEIKTDVETITGGDAAANRHFRRYGREYRSNTEIWGLPLVHIATGIDPKTGKKRIAKGIIAIGDLAFGLVAIGGGAVGGVAIGGGAIGGFALGGGAIGSLAVGGGALGLFAFGGGAIGLLVALGGLALGCGLSCGGLAVGSVATGGLAVGIFANGAGAVGLHTINEMRTDPVAERFFMQLYESLPMTIPVTVLGALLASAVVGWGVFNRYVLRGAKRTKPPRVRDKDDLEPGYGDGTKRGASCLLGTALLVVLGGCLFVPVVALLLQKEFALRQQRVVQYHAEQAQRTAVQAFEEVQRSDLLDNARRWEWKENGPTLTDAGKRAFGITRNQVDRVDNVLQSVYRAYAEIERKHTTQETNELGHVVTTITPLLQAELVSLENDLWSQLDEVLDVEQQQQMRSELYVYPKRGSSTAPYSPWEPGLLGWAPTGVKIELWTVGKWYYSFTDIRFGAQQSIGHEDRSPDLPLALRRFWPESEPPAGAAHLPQ